MKKLETRFKKNGMNYEMTHRRGMVGMFIQSDSMGNQCYVVAVIQENKAREIGGNQIPAREGFPSLEQFGSKAWQFMGCKESERLAIAKYNSLQTDLQQCATCEHHLPEDYFDGGENCYICETK